MWCWKTESILSGEPRLSVQQEWAVPVRRYLLVESLHMEANPDLTQQLPSRPSQAQPATELSRALRRKEMVCRAWRMQGMKGPLSFSSSSTHPLQKVTDISLM